MSSLSKTDITSSKMGSKTRTKDGDGACALVMRCVIRVFRFRNKESKSGSIGERIEVFAKI